MSFLAMDSQKTLFTLQRNQIQFEMTLVQNQAKRAQQYMDDRAVWCEDNEVDIDDDPEYLELERTEEYLETRQDSLESQITLLDNQISSLKTMVNNNIKNSCGLNLIGG